MIYDMRDKKSNNTGGVADGFEFTIEQEGVDLVQPKRKVFKAEVDPTRAYSKYYTPKPKKGARGGTLGRGAVDADKKKVQFSMTVTPDQKLRFQEAALKERRKLPEFICLAVEEYIERHKLL